MATEFDPYHKWLGIPAKDQPPHHYRLLALDCFEEDLEVIEAAANRQMTYVQSCATGEFVDHSQRILNEIVQARLTLLNPKKKSEYDRALQKKLDAVAAPKPKPSAPATPVGKTVPPVASKQPLSSPLDSPLAGAGLVGASGEDPLQIRASGSHSGASVSRRAKSKVRVTWQLPALIGVALVLVVVAIVVASYVPQMSGDLKPEDEGSQASHDVVVPADDTSSDDEDDDDTDSSDSDASGIGLSGERGDDGDDGFQTEDVRPNPGDADSGSDAGEIPDVPLGTNEPKAGDAGTPVNGNGTNAQNPTTDDTESTFEPKIDDTPAPSDIAEVAGEPPEEEKWDRLPVLNASELKAAKKEVLKVYRKARGDKEKERQAAQLIQDIPRYLTKPHFLYAMLEIARDNAAEVGNPPMAERAAEKTVEYFDIELNEVRIAIFEKSVRKIAPDDPTLVMLQQEAVQLVDELIEADSFDMAKRAGRVAEKLVDLNRVDELKQRLNNQKMLISSRERAYKPVAKALARLEDDPDLPAENTKVGRYYAVVRNDWDRAMPYFAKTAHVELKAAVEAELNNPTSAQDFVAVGAAWDKAAEATKKSDKDLAAAMKSRGHRWLIDGWARANEEDRVELQSIFEEKALFHSHKVTEMKFIRIPAGQFVMGSPTSESERGSIKFNGKPVEEHQHRVNIRRSFYMGIYEVTQAEYTKLAGKNPSEATKGDDHPVTHVSWNDATKFCEVMTKADPRGRYQLPTEAEWEYACRAGTTTAYYWGDAIEEGMANIFPARSQLVAVGSYAPNPFGLYDTHGNVQELTQDTFIQDLYSQSQGRISEDPVGRGKNSMRIQRGGGWGLAAKHGRSASRNPISYGTSGQRTGFRVVFKPGR